ncbi:hypothetical protein M0813_16100 [Anaeramoeba flamelloides]|uniref:Uncharacterized protein n=1 Tax=Anaeramoeba flamelloides TaxID=1746091 RepID=A0ABQ8Z0E7_9EUKA|nr:hypothetical protein M0813_16100 [Anaeramoeba flamelloides]
MSQDLDDLSDFITNIQKQRNLRRKKIKKPNDMKNDPFYPTEKQKFTSDKEIKKRKIKNYIAEKKREWRRSALESSSFSESSTKEIEKKLKKLEKITTKLTTKLETKLKRFQSHINNLNKKEEKEKESEKENKKEKEKEKEKDSQMPLPKVSIETIEIAENLQRKLKEKIDLKQEKLKQMKENKKNLTDLRQSIINDEFCSEKVQSIFHFLKTLYELQNFVDSNNLNNSQKKTFLEKLEHKLESSPTSEKTINFIFKNMEFKIEDVPITKNYYQNYQKKSPKTIKNPNLDQQTKTFGVGRVVAYLKNYKLEDFSGNLIIDTISQLIYLKNKKRKKWENRNKIPTLRVFDTNRFALAINSDPGLIKQEIYQKLTKIINQKQLNIYQDRDEQIREIAVKSFRQKESINNNPEKEISIIVQLSSQVILKKLLQECVVEFNKLENNH